MFAHVNIWTMNDAGATWDDSAACEIGATLGQQPGFRSYTVVRTGEWQVIAVTVFESSAAMEAAMNAVAPVVRARLKPLASEEPLRYRGAVLHHVVA